MAFAGELPLTDPDVDALRARLDPIEYLRTVDFLASLRVFEDEASTPLRPIFYLAPVVTADRSEEVIGEQEIAIALLDLLDSIDLVLEAIQASHRDWDRLETGRLDYLAAAEQLTAMFGQAPSAGIQRVIDYAVRGNPFVEQLGLFPARVTAAMNALPLFLRRRAATEVLRALDHLQVPLTAAERDQASSDPVQFVLGAPIKVRAKLATLLFGVRHARFVPGMSADQVRLLGHYRAIRPDVVLSALPIQLLRVVAVTATADAVGLPASSLPAPLMIRSVNASTGGTCGLATSCTVLIEYTEMGARSALLSTRGPSIMPAHFVGEIAVGPVEPITCNLATLRQRLILPFGMGVLSDREIARVLSEAGVCSSLSGTPSRSSASVALASVFRGLVFEPAQQSAFLRQQLGSELLGLLDTDSRVLARLGILGSLLRALDPEGLLARFARGQFSRLIARFPDELIAGMIVAAGPARRTIRLDFDGIAIACWKRGAVGAPYLSACPDDAPPADTQVAAAATLEARHCGVVDLVGCVAAIQANPPDERGFLDIDP